MTKKDKEKDRKEGEGVERHRSIQTHISMDTFRCAQRWEVRWQ